MTRVYIYTWFSLVRINIYIYIYTERVYADLLQKVSYTDRFLIIFFCYLKISFYILTIKIHPY